MYVKLFDHLVFDKELINVINGNKNIEIYERLEFLGDCVLNLCITKLLFFTCTTKSEGTLSKLRSILIGKEAFCFLLDDLATKKLVPSISSESFKKKSDKLEVIFGILFLEKGFEYAHKMFFTYCSFTLLSFLKKADKIDYKSLLQSFSQKAFQMLPEYVILSHSINNRQHTFIVRVNLNNASTEGKGDTLSQAQQKAAREMCSLLKLDFFSEL